MYYCQWCGQEVLTSQHICPQAAQHDPTNPRGYSVTSLKQNGIPDKVYIVYSYLYDVDLFTINSVWKNRVNAEFRSFVLDNSYIEEHIIVDWSE